MIEMYTFLAQEEDRLGDEDEDEGRIRRNLLNYDHSYILLVRADNFRVSLDDQDCFPTFCSIFKKCIKAIASRRNTLLSPQQ